MNNQDIQTKIDNYLLNRMSEAECSGFEDEMAADSQLKETVELQRLLVNEIKQRAFIAEIIEETKSKMTSPPTRRKYVPFAGEERGAVAASKTFTLRNIMIVAWSAAAIFAGTFFVNQAFVNNRMDNGFTQNFSIPETDVMRGGEDNTEQSTFIKAIELIQEQPEQALEALQALYKQPYTYTYYEDVRWYMALTELKLHNKHEAIKYLKELMNSEFYGEKASKLLEEL